MMGRGGRALLLGGMTVALSIALVRDASARAWIAGPCTQAAGNLTVNGSMQGPGNPVFGFGIIADGWSPFGLSSIVPTFEWVDYNTNGDMAGTGSEYIWADLDQFDAGIYQTISGLTPGLYYRFWLGSALAAFDENGSGNQRTDTIGRQVGVDPTGGTDPDAATVSWGEVYWDGQAALNIPALSRVFAPRADRATIFLRVINQNTRGRSKVWFDSVCMQLLESQPNSLFLPWMRRYSLDASPTATPVSSIQVREETVTLNAYPYEAFSNDAFDTMYNWSYRKFDLTFYRAALVVIEKFQNNNFRKRIFTIDVFAGTWWAFVAGVI